MKLGTLSGREGAGLGGSPKSTAIEGEIKRVVVGRIEERARSYPADQELQY